MSPRVVVVEEVMRDGLQIESPAIPLADKLALLDALSAARLPEIVVGSFVSAKWTPQMAHVDELVQALRPAPGVTYRGIALNERGRERLAAHSPPLTPDPLPETTIELCEVFIQRNTNRTIADQEASWKEPIARAVANGTREAGVALSNPWGSNWRGEFTPERRIAELERQFEAWARAGIAVTRVTLRDAMGWNRPDQVVDDLRAIGAAHPAVRTFNLHLHNQRGLALVSIYAALKTLGAADTLVVDAALGGLAGCPYCGNGRAAGLAPTEDVVHLLEELGVSTGVDLDRLIDAAALASEIVGRPLDGRVSKAGPLPRGERLYPGDLPVIETHEQASHFRLGPAVHEGQPRPWERTPERPGVGR